MESLMFLIIGILKITILDLTLSGDNIGVIALATKKLPSSYAKKASLVGITGAIGLRIAFACVITLIMNIQWLPIKLVGGLFLVKITWDFIKPDCQGDGCSCKKAEKFWEAVAIIVIADISMSLDNVIAIASAANGSVLLIVVGILINVPIIFFGSQFVANLMKKYPIFIYLGGGILAHTSLKMILEDKLTMKYIGFAPSVLTIIPWFFAIGILVYGCLIIKKSKITLETNS